jgi:hypothetical protein
MPKKQKYRGVKCEVYKRMLCNGIHYSCADYVSDKRCNNDSCVMTKRNVIALIQKIVAAPNNEVCIIVRNVYTDVMNINAVKCLNLNYIMNVNSYGDLFTIFPKDLLCQCLFFNNGNVKYVCAIPYGCLGD